MITRYFNYPIKPHTVGEQEVAEDNLAWCNCISLGTAYR
jgi:hypothetical protein